MAAFKAAVQAGMRPDEFWGMTPYLTRQAVVALRDGKTRELWMAAALQRRKKLPPLESLMIDKGPAKDQKQMESELKKALRVKRK
jgi:hypothetical protein